MLTTTCWIEKFDKLVLLRCMNGCHATPVPDELVEKAREFTHARVTELPMGMGFSIQLFNEEDLSEESRV